MNFLDLSDVSTSSLSYISQVFDDVKPILIIVFGLIVGFFIIEKLIELVEEFIEKKEIPEEERKAIHEAFEREEREYRKIQEMIKRKDIKAMEEWLEKWRKGEIEW
jgi:polyhydroxyalkanoate synthesis regulator phasin